MTTRRGFLVGTAATTAVSALPAPAVLAGVGIGSAEDPYRLNETTKQIGLRIDQAGAKIVSSPILAPGETTLIFIVAGQSNGANYGNAGYTPSNPTKIDNVSVFDGQTYRGVDPFIGAEGGGGTWFGQLADKLIVASICARCIFAPLAIGGTKMSQWTTGGVHNDRLLVAYRRLLGLSLTPSAVLWQIGETDGNDGTTQAAFESQASAAVSQMHGLGMTAPHFFAKSTMLGGVTNSTIRAAIAALPNGSTIYAGPDTDTLTGGANRYDNTHWTATGADNAAALWKNALDAAF